MSEHPPLLVYSEDDILAVLDQPRGLTDIGYELAIRLGDRRPTAERHTAWSTVLRRYGISTSRLERTLGAMVERGTLLRMTGAVIPSGVGGTFRWKGVYYLRPQTLEEYRATVAGRAEQTRMDELRKHALQVVLDRHADEVAAELDGSGASRLNTRKSDGDFRESSDFPAVAAAPGPPAPIGPDSQVDVAAFTGRLVISRYTEPARGRAARGRLVALAPCCDRPVRLQEELRNQLVVCCRCGWLYRVGLIDENDGGYLAQFRPDLTPLVMVRHR